MNRLLTFRRPVSRGASRTMTLLFCAALAFSASCGADYGALTDGPGVPALIPGSFVLAAVDGKIPPYNPPNSNVTFIAGDCVTTSEKFTLNMTTAIGTAAPAVATSSGFILPFNKGSVTFQFAASSVQATALITGNGFALTYNGLTLLFERVG